MLKNKLGYLLFLIIGGLFAVLYNEYFIGIIFISAVLLPIVLLGISIYSSRKIKIKLDTTTLIVGKEEYLNLTINLKNTSVFPISRMNLLIQYYNEFSGEIKKETIQVVLDQKSSQNVSCQITSRYCGNLLFEVKSIKLYDYFHIWSIRRKTGQSAHVAVFPETFEIPGDIITENLSLMIDSDIYAENRPGDDPSEVFGIREYREGDKPNRIHWKLSYKQEQLMIKEFSDPIKDSIVVFVNLNCGEKHEKRLKIVDGILDCAISVSYNLLINEHIHRFAWYDGSNKEVKQFFIHNQPESLAAIETILKTPYRPDRPSILAEYNRNLQKQNDTHMIYITSVLLEEEIYEWAELHKGTLIYLMYVNYLDNYPLSENFKTLLQDLKINYYEIDCNNIKESITAIGAI